MFAMVVCVLFPRFALVAALGDRQALLAEPAALAPEPGRPQLVGEVSAATETFGVVPGMRVGEALARCPELRLRPTEPAGGGAGRWRAVPSCGSSHRIRRGCGRCGAGCSTGSRPSARRPSRTRPDLRTSTPTGCAGCPA